MKKINILVIAFLLLTINLMTAQNRAAEIEKNITIIKEIVENYNYDSYGIYLSKPFLNKNASFEFSSSTGLMKMSNMAIYGTYGKTNFNLELNVKKIDPKWINATLNQINNEYSGFSIETSDEAYRNELEIIKEGKVNEEEDDEYVYTTGIVSFKGKKGLELAEALKNICTLMYKAE